MMLVMVRLIGSCIGWVFLPFFLLLFLLLAAARGIAIVIGCGLSYYNLRTLMERGRAALGDGGFCVSGDGDDAEEGDEGEGCAGRETE